MNKQTLRQQIEADIAAWTESGHTITVFPTQKKYNKNRANGRQKHRNTGSAPGQVTSSWRLMPKVPN